MFDEPTVAQRRSITATFACRKLLVVLVDLDAGVEERAVERARGVVQEQYSGLPCSSSVTRTPRAAASVSARRK